MKSIFWILIFMSFAWRSIAVDQKVNNIRRHLLIQDKCNTFSSCQSCSASLNCKFTNGLCSVYDRKELERVQVNLDISQQNWFNSNGAEYLQLDETTQDLQLYRLDNNSHIDYKFCEWRINSTQSGTVTLTINRTTGYNEDFWMKAVTNSGVRTYRPKDFINCENEDEFTITLTNLKFLILKSHILNEKSEFIVTVSKTIDQKQTKNDSWSVLQISGLAILWVLLCALNVWMLNWLKELCKTEHKQTLLLENIQKRKQLIQNCLASMKSGWFKNFNILFDQSTWVMWLESLNPEDQINITNEWKHVFHTECIKKWFNNIVVDKEITCPIWNSSINESQNCDKSIWCGNTPKLATNLDFQDAFDTFHLENLETSSS